MRTPLILIAMGLGDAIIRVMAGVSAKTFPPPCVMGDESIMSQKAHGTSAVPVQDNLRWNCDGKTADRICNFNRHYAEHSGYWETTTFLKEMGGDGSGGGGPSQPIQFFDSNTGKLLFEAPKGRTWEEFVRESKAHGWPSFRDQEVEWNNVRVLPNGEAVSVDGTHLGHNLPDRKGSRYCINLVSVAGRPASGGEGKSKGDEL